MVFFQWATLPADQPQRIHGTVHALLNGDTRLCMSAATLDEVREVLTDEELLDDYPQLTPEHVAAILDKMLQYADWFDDVPRRFSLSGHARDNHLFNLAIEASARYLDTFESRLGV